MMVLVISTHESTWPSQRQDVNGSAAQGSNYTKVKPENSLQSTSVRVISDVGINQLR